MQAWQISTKEKIEKADRTELLTDIDSVKLRITKALITSEDIVTYLGEDDKVKYPVIPCTAAIGQINELPAESPYFEKGTRVYVSAVDSCGKCPHCVNGHPERCYEFSVAGKNKDGFLKDFAVVPAADVFALPQSIKDESAIYIELIKLALAVIDELKVEKGQHVAVIGGTILGSIISQLIIYYQGVPILIDSSEEKLALAEKAGVYYTIKADKTAEKEVSALTGGRMTMKVVHVARSGMPFDLAFRLAAPTASVAFAGFSFPDVRLSFRSALEKRLKCFSVANGYGNSESAINMLANKAVDLSDYAVPVTPLKDVAANFAKMATAFKENRTVDPIIVNMID